MYTKITTFTLTALAVLVAAAPASAHVTAQPPEHAAGGFTVVNFRVPSEQDAPTTKVEVQFPEGVSSARTQPVPGWKATVNMATLDEPISDGHGGEVTEQVESISWEGGEIVAGEFQEFPVSLKMLEEGELGDSVFFPAIQTYEGGEEVAWTEKPSSEGDDAELERPAPSVTLSAAGDGHGGAAAGPGGSHSEGSGEGGGSGDPGDRGDSMGGSDASSDVEDVEMRANIALGLAIAALVIGLVGLLARRGGTRS